MCPPLLKKNQLVFRLCAIYYCTTCHVGSMLIMKIHNNDSTAIAARNHCLYLKKMILLSQKVMRSFNG